MSERKYLLHRDAGYIVSLERQAAKQYRREHGGMSGRQFKRARKAGQRAAREAARQAAQANADAYARGEVALAMLEAASQLKGAAA